MATVVLIHSALGLTSHVKAWADALREDGHDVIAPDLFDGRTFADVDEAVAFTDELGLGHWVRVAAEATAGVTGPRVYAGFSLGGAVAEVLALTQPEASGLVLMHAAVSPAWFEIERWPAGLTAQLHYAALDPWMEEPETSALLELAAASGAADAIEVFEYEGARHLFAFEGYREYHEEAAHELFERVTDYLAGLDA